MLSSAHPFNSSSIGLGLRREFQSELLQNPTHFQQHFDFIEISPENWIGVGGFRAEELQKLLSYFTCIAHGLCLSIGSQEPLNQTLLQDLKTFLTHYNIKIFSDHLSFSSDEKGYFYDLLPLPGTEKMVKYVADRVSRVQDFLGQQIALENISSYYLPEWELSELEFLLAVAETADCKLLLDVNNVYVNSINQNFDAKHFIANIPTKRIAYLHIAGHKKINATLLLDNHGAPVCKEVWELLQYTYETHGFQPTLLERDINIPPLPELITELDMIKTLQNKITHPIAETLC